MRIGMTRPKMKKMLHSGKKTGMTMTSMMISART